MSCEFAHADGAYVLGALSPAERLEFEQHLAGCVECARAVRELAGLPGLLSRIDPSVLEHPPSVEPVPATLLPALTHAVRRTQRRRVLVGAAAAAVVAAAVAAVPLALSGDGTDRSPTAGTTPTASVSATPAGETMVPVGRAHVTASLGFEPVAWGTRLDLVCTYAPDPDHYLLPRTPTYALFVRTRDGDTEQVGTWRSVEGRTMRITAATAATREEISSVEVRTTDGRPVLKLTG